ncbi:hypothetical protein [Klebsiella variicola]|uniref:hypothetical protein n=1 Tax=Klebsiella variicola TaxID=244366 RepID=UPI000D74C85D|nr:hypothetical protein [Klebsiella variicola]PXK73547.1 hypothetical protein DMS23_07860 [Klebsiella variicola]
MEEHIELKQMVEEIEGIVKGYVGGGKMIDVTAVLKCNKLIIKISGISDSDIEIFFESIPVDERR